MRTLVVLFLCVSVALAYKYVPLSDDEKRDAMFADCKATFPLIPLVTNNTDTGARTQMNMRECSGRCNSQYRSTSYSTYLQCFSCCDSYYGRTPESDRRPVFGMTEITYYDSPAYSGSNCQHYKFPQAFAKDFPVDKIRVYASISHRPWGYTLTPRGGTHDAQVVWIEQVTTESAQVCISETLRHDQSHDSNVRVSLLVVDSLMQSRTISGSAIVKDFTTVDSMADTKACTKVSFPKALDFTPGVVLTPTHRNTAVIHRPITSWIQESSNVGFTACFFTATNSHLHTGMGFDWLAFPLVNLNTNTNNLNQNKKNLVVEGSQGTVLYQSGSVANSGWTDMQSDASHICQRVSFTVPFASDASATPNVIISPIAKSPVTIWMENVDWNGFDVCVAFANGWLPMPAKEATGFNWLAVAADPNMKGSPARNCQGLTTGIHDLDIDLDPTTPPERFYCRAGGLLVASLFNTEEDDFPNDIETAHQGWKKTSSGQWAKGDPDLIVGYDKVSSAMSVSRVQKILEKQNMNTLKMCFINANLGETICRKIKRNINRGEAPLSVTNPIINRYVQKGNTDQLPWTYARMIGLPYSKDACYQITKDKPADLCSMQAGSVTRDPGNWHDFGTSDGSYGMQEHATGAPYTGWNGVWHGWGAGCSFRPAETDLYELANYYAANPNGNTGFQLWIAP